MNRRLPQFEFLEQMRNEFKNDLPPTKPCPFCGNGYIDLEGVKSVSVVCHKCKAEGPPSSSDDGPYQAIRDAINGWNLRVSE